jgi:hypothetical protein
MFSFNKSTNAEREDANERRESVNRAIEEQQVVKKARVPSKESRERGIRRS